MQITELLQRVHGGDKQALGTVIPLVYAELKKLAAGHLRHEGPARPIETMALVHEAFLRLAHGQHPSYENRSHFYGIASRLMRQILVDLARARAAEKRDAMKEVHLTEIPDMGRQSDESLLILDGTLERLASTDPLKVQLIEMRAYVGNDPVNDLDVTGLMDSASKAVPKMCVVDPPGCSLVLKALGLVAASGATGGVAGLSYKLTSNIKHRSKMRPLILKKINRLCPPQPTPQGSGQTAPLSEVAPALLQGLEPGVNAPTEPPVPDPWGARAPNIGPDSLVPLAEALIHPFAEVIRNIRDPRHDGSGTRDSTHSTTSGSRKKKR